MHEYSVQWQLILFLVSVALVQESEGATLRNIQELLRDAFFLPLGPHSSVSSFGPPINWR